MFSPWRLPRRNVSPQKCPKPLELNGPARDALERLAAPDYERFGFSRDEA
jgi:hypothetical protein